MKKKRNGEEDMKKLKHKKFKALAAWWKKEDDEIRPVWLREKVVFLVFIFSILGDSPPKNWFDCVFVLDIHFQFSNKVSLNTEN